MLDADSVMSAEAVLRLIRIMQADPEMGIVQHLTVGLPAERAFPRLFQFGMRAGMRVWATGQAWWQQSDGPYWGHNAIIRIAAFSAHCRLKPLPNGQTILSHDQIEAAMLRAAGWKVCVWAAEEGSQEANPPALPEFQARDSRWLAGNFQYFHLLRAPGFRPMGRWQLVQAIMLFAGSPLYCAIMLLAALSAATGGGDAVPFGTLVALMLSWAGILYAPKLLGYTEVLLSPHLRAQYGGISQFLRGVTAETLFTLLLDALAGPSKTLAMIRVKTGWQPQNRTARGVGWGEAARLYWPHTLFGLVLFGLLGMSSWRVALGAIPFMGGMVVAIPFCVWTADPAFSAWLKRRGIAAIPEEI
jgi:membrane glycosyltransferase